MKILNALKKLKNHKVVLITIILALLIGGGVFYYSLDRSGDEASQGDVTEGSSEEGAVNEEGKEIAVLDAGSKPTTYEEQLEAVEAADNSSEEVKIFTYYNAAMFSARARAPEARRLANETLELIDSAEIKNTVYDSFKPNLKAISEGRYGDIKVPQQEQP